MGFSGIASSMIMFIAVISLSLTVVAAFKNVADTTASSMQIQSEAMAKSARTDLHIESLTYSNITDITTMYIRNTGKTVLDMDKMDVYIDGLFIPRNESDRTIKLESTTDIKNPGLYDPGEIIEIKVFKVLSSGMHTMTFGVQYSFKVEDIFSVA